MALTKFGFIVTGDNFTQYQGTEKFMMKVVGAGKIIEAIEYKVPVGVVAYGPESIDSMHRLFAD